VRDSLQTDSRRVILLSEEGRLPNQPALEALSKRYNRDVLYFDAERVPEKIDLDRVEVFVPPLPHRFGPSTRAVLRSTPSLHVVQLLSAGVDHVHGLIREGVVLCTAAGVRDGGVAELALGLILMQQRDLSWHARRTGEGAWERDHLSPGLHGRRLLLVGYGGIGQRFERAIAGFDVECAVVARTARPAVHGGLPVHGIGELDELLPEADIVVLMLPLTPDTVGLFDAKMLSLMKTGSLLVNVARGAIVDTDALTAETESGRLRAALDVIDPEPLPPEHRLRHTPGVIITPHVSGNTAYGRRLEGMLVESQLRRLFTSRALANMVTV
jgi:phosphoglycerate dehydrogenase-like enzyme